MRAVSQRRSLVAVLVAGGLGTRMLPLTERRPKHLLEVGGVPFLEHQLAKLAGAGVGHVVLATSYRAELFQPVLGRGERFGVRLGYVTEDEPLGTGGAIRHAVDRAAPAADPGGAVVVLNGDVLSGHDLTAQLADFDRPRGGRPVDVSLHLVRVADPRPFGSVTTGPGGRVTAFVEKSAAPVTDQVNAGCYVLRRRVVEAIPAGRVVSVERETFPALVASGALVTGYVETAYWRDIGTPEALVAASRDVVLGTAPTAAAAPGPGGVKVAAGAEVAGEVRDDSCLLPGVRVGRGATVSGSVLMAGAVVGPGAVVVDSVLGPGARVGAAARLHGVAVGDEAVVADRSRLGPGTRVRCGGTA